MTRVLTIVFFSLVVSTAYSQTTIVVGKESAIACDFSEWLKRYDAKQRPGWQYRINYCLEPVCWLDSSGLHVVDSLKAIQAFSKLSTDAGDIIIQNNKEFNAIIKILEVISPEGVVMDQKRFAEAVKKYRAMIQ